MLDTPRVTARVIREVAGTIATNGIQELDKTERGGVSQFGYVRACLTATAYNALRAMDGFSMSHNEFFAAVEAQTIKDLDDDSDKDFPARVCVEMARYEVQRLIEELQHYLPTIQQ